MSMLGPFSLRISYVRKDNTWEHARAETKFKQAGAELGQAQLKLGLAFLLHKIYCIKFTCK